MANVKTDFGAAGDGVADDTAAIQAAINSLAATGGDVVFPDGQYRVSHLYIPTLPRENGPGVSIRFRGLTPLPRSVSVLQPLPAPNVGAILLGNGTQSILSASSPPDSVAPFTMVNVEVEDLLFRQPANPSGHCLDLGAALACRLTGVVCDAGNWGAYSIAEPTAGGVGVILPANNNGAWTVVESLLCVGLHTGLVVAEHAHVHDYSAYACIAAMKVQNAYHAMKVQRAAVQNCRYGLWFVGGDNTGGARIDVAMLDTEIASSGWAASNRADLYDPSSYGIGTVRWASVLAGVGQTPTWVQVGGAGMFVSQVSSVAPLPGNVFIVNDSDPGFSTTSGWTAYTGAGFRGDLRYAPSGNGSSVATWSFAVPAGQYRVSATWNVVSDHATNAPYTVYDGSTLLGTFAMNQKTAPSDRTDQGVGWEDLGTFTVSGGTLVIKVTNAANGYVIADAVRVEKVG